MGASTTLKLAFILSATDKMSRIVDEAVKKSTDKLSAFERTTGKVGRSMMKAGTVMVGAGAAIGGAMLGMAKSTADYGNTAAKTARSVGMDAESFQKLAFAAKYAGVDQQKFSAAMVKFNKNIVDAASGSGKATQLFKEMGISVKDSAGNLRAPNEVLADVADKFKEAPNGAMKTAAAYDLLGRSGADMVSLLNGGSKGLAEMAKKAEDMGAIIGNNAAEECEHFVDQLDYVKNSAQGLIFQFGSALMPMLNNVAEKIEKAIQKATAWAKENPKLATTIGKVGMVLTGLLVTVGTASFLFGSLTFIVGKFAKAFRAASTAIKLGKKIVNEYKTGMLLFRMQYALFSIQTGVATAKQWLFNTSLFACPIVWIIAGIMAIIGAVVLMVKYWGNIAAFFKKIWSGIVGIFSKAWDGIKTVWGAVAGWFSNLWGNIKTNIASAWEGIKRWFSNLNPVEWISGAWNRVGGFFGNLGTRFYEWGKNILQGLWKGITSMVNKVVEGVKNIGHKIAKGFKAIFGINSPSKLFAEYGLNITQGLVVGIDHGGGAVENATEGLAASATSGISQSLQSSSVYTSNTFNAGNSGITLNYSPQITITGGTTPEIRDEFSKMLRQHANEIVSIIRRDAENTARLSFNL